MGEETFAYDLITNRAICLNRMSSLIWKHCDGNNSVSAIAGIASKELGENVSVELVELALDQLSKEGLLEDHVSPGTFEGMSRREILRKVGLTTMAALPIVTAITAPSAAAAQSACVPGGSCTCSTSSGGMQGQVCVPSAGMGCANPICRCTWENNGNAMGTCII